MPSPWAWVPEAHVYRNTATGRFIGVNEQLGLRDQWMKSLGDSAIDLSRRVASGEMDLTQWQTSMRADIKAAYIDQYALGKGGRNALTLADKHSIGGMLTDQYKHLQAFAREIQAGNLTEAQIAARSKMYTNSSVEAFERAHARSMGMPDLPHYPGDGDSECLTNCHCHWNIVETAEGWDCYWVPDTSVENCETCRGYAADYNPLRLEKK